MIVGVMSPYLWACACGCGIFDVSSRPMLPTHPGGMVFLNYNFLDQFQPVETNENKQIRTHFWTGEVQYLFNRQWGIQAELPVWFRSVKNDEDTSFSSLGDIRINGIYTGLSPDMSTGFTFGVKLATGETTHLGLERDLQIGSGSTDILLGAYQLKTLDNEGLWTAFGQIQVNLPMLISGDYRPGSELNAVIGMHYHGWTVGEYTLSPVLQATSTSRWMDSGLNADSDNSGYQRLLVSPGLEINMGDWCAYTILGFPIIDHVNGAQLIAPNYFKLSIGRSF